MNELRDRLRLIVYSIEDAILFSKGDHNYLIALEYTLSTLNHCKLPYRDCYFNNNEKLEIERLSDINDTKILLTEIRDYLHPVYQNDDVPFSKSIDLIITVLRAKIRAEDGAILKFARKIVKWQEALVNFLRIR